MTNFNQHPSKAVISKSFTYFSNQVLKFLEQTKSSKERFPILNNYSMSPHNSKKYYDNMYNVNTMYNENTVNWQKLEMTNVFLNHYN